MLTTADVPRPRLIAAVIVLLICGPFAPSAHAARGVYACSGSLDIPQSPKQTAVAEVSIACLVNVERLSLGVPPLTRNPQLARAARGHASDMSLRGYFSHISTTGARLSDRLRDAGYGDPGDGWYAGEDLGWGSGDRATPNSLVDAWLNSVKHRRVLLSPVYEELGIGVAQGAPTASPGELPGATYAMDLATIRAAGDQ
jgi:uncharacterized protein YkwD